MKYSFLFISIFIILKSVSVKAQERISFYASDSLIVTADFYEGTPGKPYLLLFHQANSSRGEYSETAPKFAKMGFNCLAVDLRSGGESNFSRNLTLDEAVKKGFTTTYIDAEKDIYAAIEFAFEKSGKPVILFGSSYSASLCLKVSKKNEKVSAVVAFSPGEFFKPMVIQNEIEALKTPVFIACSQREYPYTVELMSKVISDIKVIYKPSGGPGEHGSKALWESCNVNDEYWMALISFLNKFLTADEE